MRSFVRWCCLSLLVSGIVAASEVRACGPAVAVNCVTTAAIVPSAPLFVPTIVSPFAATTFVVPQAVVVQQAAVLRQATVPHVVTHPNLSGNKDRQACFLPRSPSDDAHQLPTKP